MRVDFLLDRLSRVKQRGPDQWMCCCPAHQDRTASLSVKALDDGRVLLHCFAGCTPDDVLGSVGLQFSDIMPERVAHHAPAVRHVIPAADALRILGSELTVIAVIASDIMEHREIDEPTWQRFATAARRVNEIREFTRE
jgi:DNA primase